MNNVNVFDVLKEKLNQNVNESIKDLENFKSSELYKNKLQFGGYREIEKIPVYNILGARIDTYFKAIGIVNQIEREYNNGWIPCSERLPKEDDFPEQRYRVLASCSDGIVRNATIKSLLNEELHFSRGNTFTYVAWKPLPEPYKEKQKFSDELLEKVWNEILN